MWVGSRILHVHLEHRKSKVGEADTDPLLFPNRAGFAQNTEEVLLKGDDLLLSFVVVGCWLFVVYCLLLVVVGCSRSSGKSIQPMKDVRECVDGNNQQSVSTVLWKDEKLTSARGRRMLALCCSESHGAASSGVM